MLDPVGICYSMRRKLARETKQIETNLIIIQFHTDTNMRHTHTTIRTHFTLILFHKYIGKVFSISRNFPSFKWKSTHSNWIACDPVHWVSIAFLSFFLFVYFIFCVVIKFTFRNNGQECPSSFYMHYSQPHGEKKKSNGIELFQHVGGLYARANDSK